MAELRQQTQQTLVAAQMMADSEEFQREVAARIRREEREKFIKMVEWTRDIHATRHEMVDAMTYEQACDDILAKLKGH